MDNNDLVALALSIPAFVAGLTVHEFAHAWMANKLGDDTPRRMGRLTLDPFSHLDPLGSAVFFLSGLFGYIGIGWAKPVPFNPRNLRHPQRDRILIALAGPVSNLLQIPVWLLLLYLTRLALGPSLFKLGMPVSMAGALIEMLAMGVLINLVLAAFNMIPLPPLDGHYVLEGLGPPAVADFYNTIRPFSCLILLVAINLPGDPLGTALGPIIGAGATAIGLALGVS